MFLILIKIGHMIKNMILSLYFNTEMTKKPLVYHCALTRRDTIKWQTIKVEKNRIFHKSDTR